MRHVSSRDLEWRGAPAEHFDGQVLLASLSDVEGGIAALGVMFDPGAMTHWHHHPQGQVLYVVAGSGRVETRAGEEVRITAGDVVYAPAGEVHRHGATADSFLVHLSLVTGAPTRWDGESD